MACHGQFVTGAAGCAEFTGWKLAGFGVVVACLLTPSTLQAFEGRIDATLTRGGEVQTWHYSVGTNCIRIERGDTNWPYAKNLIARDTGDITLLFPHNRSFVRFKPATRTAVMPSPLMPAMPAPPPGIGPQTQPPPAAPALPAGVGPTNLPGLPPPPAMPQMPALPARPPMPAGGGMMPTMPMMPMPGEALELKATGETTNLLGYACIRYEIKQRGEVMEIWATDKLLPFQAWLPNQPPRFGPQMLEETWGDLLKSKKLFPLLAVIKFDNGPERLCFAVQSVTPETIKDPDGALFQPPADYQEIEPLPF